jgi:hypothetical protein
MWAMLTDIANTHPWAGWVTKEGWKTVFADSTRNLTVKEMNELLARIQKFADDNHVKLNNERGLIWKSSEEVDGQQACPRQRSRETINHHLLRGVNE